MSRALKIIVLIVVGLLLLVAAAVAVVLSLDPNSFRDDIRRLAASQAGLDLDIQGNLSWQLLPRISITVENVRAGWLSGAQADDPNLAQLGALRLDAALWPLISTQPALEITGIHLERPQLHLLRRADGSVNWEPPASDTPAESGSGPTPGLTVLRASISDAQVLFEDRSAGTRVELADLDLDAAAELIPLQVPATLSFRLVAPEVVTGELALVVTREGDNWRAGDITGDGSWQVGSETLPWRLRGAVTAMADQSLRLDDVSAALADVVAQVSGTASSEALDLRLALPATNPSKLARAFDPTVPDVGVIGFSANLTGNAQDLQLSQLDLQLPGGRFNGSAGVQSPDGQPMQIQLNLASPQFDLNKVLALVPAEAAATEPAGPAKAPAAAGTATAAASTSAAAAKTTPAAADQAVAALPLLPLAIADLPHWQAHLQVAKLLLPDALTISDVDVNSVHGGNTLALDLTAGSLFDGPVAATLNISELRGEPRWQITTRADGVQSRAILLWLGQTPDLEAALQVQGKYTARGRSMGDVLDTVTGSLNFDGGQGKLDLRRFKQQVLTAASLAGNSDKVANWPDILDYRRLTGTVNLEGVDNQRISLRLDNLEADATGGIAWRASTLDYRAQVVIKDDPKYHSFDINKYLVGVPLPVRCQGLLDAPGLCTLDKEAMNKVIADALTGTGNKAVQERIDRAIEEKVPEEFRDAAKGLLDLLRQGRGN